MRAREANVKTVELFLTLRGDGEPYGPGKHFDWPRVGYLCAIFVIFDDHDDDHGDHHYGEHA